MIDNITWQYPCTRNTGGHRSDFQPSRPVGYGDLQQALSSNRPRRERQPGRGRIHHGGIPGLSQDLRRQPRSIACALCTRGHRMAHLPHVHPRLSSLVLQSRRTLPAPRSIRRRGAGCTWRDLLARKLFVRSQSGQVLQLPQPLRLHDDLQEGVSAPSYLNSYAK